MRVTARIAELARDVDAEVDVLGPVYVYPLSAAGCRKLQTYRLVRVLVAGEDEPRAIAVERLPDGCTRGLREVARG
jgi:hypothetical protein